MSEPIRVRPEVSDEELLKIQETIQSLVRDGLLYDTGLRRCANGRAVIGSCGRQFPARSSKGFVRPQTAFDNMDFSERHESTS